MPEDNEPKQAKPKGRTRPSFSAPVYAAEPRAAGWVDLPTTPPVEPPVAPVAAPEVAVLVVTRRARVLPKPRAVYRPESASPAAEIPGTLSPVTSLAPIEEPIEVEYDRPTLSAPSATATQPAPVASASVSGVVIAGVSVAVGMAILSTYVAFEIFAFPLRVAVGIIGPRKQR